MSVSFQEAIIIMLKWLAQTLPGILGLLAFLLVTSNQFNLSTTLKISFLISTTLLWRRKCQPTAVFFPGESHGQRRLVDYCPWGCKESDLRTHQTLGLNILTTEHCSVRHFSWPVRMTDKSLHPFSTTRCQMVHSMTQNSCPFPHTLLQKENKGY